MPPVRQLGFVPLALLALLPAATAPVPSPVQRPPQKAAVSLTFGVYQTDKATVMYRSFTPLIDALQDLVAARLERPVDIQLTIFKSYDDGIDALCKGTVDFVHFGPASYVLAKQRNPDVELLAMEHENGAKRFSGVIFVARDSAVRKLADLRGRSFAFGDPNSTIGRWLVQAELVGAGITASDLSTYTYHERHDQVAAVVEHGDFDAGSVKLSTFEKANANKTLRTIATFDNVTKPVVARDGLDREVFAAIQASLFDLSDPALFKDLKISGFVTATDDEYQFVRDGMTRALDFGPTRGH
jgi:phosphonate transport system substrate-binding protein